MSRGFAGTVALTLFAGLLFGPSPSTRAQIVEPRPDRAQHLTAPPLIVAPGAETPIRLQDARVAMETQGSMARTTVDLTLFNPNRRVLEGTLEFPLRSNQQIAGFALDIGDEMRDAVPVPKEKAQQVFESVERRGIDPGIAEQTAGNQFRVRVYPIPAQGVRHVRLLIDEVMPRDFGMGNGQERVGWRWTLPTTLLASAEHLAMDLRAQSVCCAPSATGAFAAVEFKRDGRAYVAHAERSGAADDREFSVFFPASEHEIAGTMSGEQSSAYVDTFDGARYFFAEISLPPPPPGGLEPLRPASTLGLLWDASASMRTRDRLETFAVLDQYFRAMGNGSVALRYLRDVGTDAGRFEVRDGDWSALRKVLESTVYDGASDLADWTPDPAIRTYVLVSDGVRSYGRATLPMLRDDQALYALAPRGEGVNGNYLAAISQARGGNLQQLGKPTYVIGGKPKRILALDGVGVTDLVSESPLTGDGETVRIAGRLTADAGRIRVKLGTSDRSYMVEVPIAADAPRGALAPRLWAKWTLDSFAEDPESHRAQAQRLGAKFGIVTPGTSLLVLENPDDYVRYDIPAPASLRKQVDALRSQRDQELAAGRQRRLDEVAARFADRAKWWDTHYPKGAPPKSKKEGKIVADGMPAPVAEAVPPPPEPTKELPAPSASDVPARNGESLDKVEVIGGRIRQAVAADAAAGPVMTLDRDDAPGQGIAIHLQAWEPDAAYARRLRDAKPEDTYALYLDERDSHADSTAFYLDVADLLLKKGRRAEALRVLSNLAEMKLENRHILRVLGYRLMQAGEFARAVDVFRDVLRLADEEPQSHRDLGLALASAGERQEAIRHLYDVAARDWDSRFSEVELVALNEMNETIATSPKPLDTDFVDPRLLRNMPLDLRVVLSWDSDNSDMDLWVTDPNGEKCFYGNRNTYQGGLLSDDFTGGYGPEEFVLRDAKPGKYKVEANFFGDRQQIVTGATTLNLRLITGWGTSKRKDQTVTLRLSGRSETVLVGEFEVK